MHYLVHYTVLPITIYRLFNLSCTNNLLNFYSNSCASLFTGLKWGNRMNTKFSLSRTIPCSFINHLTCWTCSVQSNVHSFTHVYHPKAPPQYPKQFQHFVASAIAIALQTIFNSASSLWNFLPPLMHQPAFSVVKTMALSHGQFLFLLKTQLFSRSLPP